MEHKIGLLGGGNMAGALIRGLLASGTVDANHLRASDVRAERLDELGKLHGIECGTDNVALVRWANVVIVAVKPQVVDRVITEIAPALGADHLLISIAAGVPIGVLEARVPDGTRVVRAMPNTAAIVLAGATGIAPGRHATGDDTALARRLFDAVGRSVVLDESALDAVTGLSGSGPAYVMMVIEALADGGVKVGLPRDVALLLAAQTVYGSARLQIETNEHPARLKDMVTSPGGTTIAGVHALETCGIRRAFIDAVEAATRRSSELGRATAERLGVAKPTK
jgi:pyrroline-5-carboxylate reductase